MDDLLKDLSAELGLSSADMKNDMAEVVSALEQLQQTSDNGTQKTSSTKTESLLKKQIDLEKRYDLLYRKLRRFQFKRVGKHSASELRKFYTFAKANIKSSAKTSQNIPSSSVLTPSEDSKMLSKSALLKLVRSIDTSNVDIDKKTFAGGDNSNAKVIVKMEEGLISKLHAGAQSITKCEVLNDHSSAAKSLQLDLNQDEKECVNRVSQTLINNMHNIYSDIDSDATESSSSDESCDDASTNFFRDSYSTPISQNSQWRWYLNRCKIASKWTWLQAQISDLEYRIRQQTEIFKQLSAKKSPVTFADRLDEELRKYEVEKGRIGQIGVRSGFESDSAGLEPARGSATEDPTCVASRTRPVLPVKRRKVFGTLGLHHVNSKAAKLNDVQCTCIYPHSWCILCSGRINGVLDISTVLQADAEKRKKLIDHSYHHVLSEESSLPLSSYLNASLAKDNLSVNYQQIDKLLKQTKKENLRQKLKDKEKNSDRKKSSKKKRKKLSEASSDGKDRKEEKIEKERRSSLRSTNPSGDSVDSKSTLLDDELAEYSLDIRPNSPLSKEKQPWHEQTRKRRESSFDINNIVIPYSIAANTRVEMLQYKEIITPDWRYVINSDAKQDEDDAEDSSDAAYITRHNKAETEEKIKWLPGAKKHRPCRRTESRTESSGHNTPDNPLSPLSVHEFHEERILRERKASSPHPKERTASEDSSRPPTPEVYSLLEVAPFDQRTFPLTDQQHLEMISDMPEDHEFPPKLVHTIVKPDSVSDIGSIKNKFVSEESVEKNVSSVVSPASTNTLSEFELDETSNSDDSNEDPEWTMNVGDTPNTNVLLSKPSIKTRKRISKKSTSKTDDIGEI